MKGERQWRRAREDRSKRVWKRLRSWRSQPVDQGDGALRSECGAMNPMSPPADTATAMYSIDAGGKRKFRINTMAQ